MSGHTPGPWKITDHFRCILEGPGGRLVGRTDVMSFMSDFTEENKANARLIAAAPEMLEALHQITDCSVGFAAAGIAGHERVLGLASIAIAKAEGR